MHDLLRRFGSVPLALAAYNAGAGAVARVRLRAADTPRPAATSPASSGCCAGAGGHDGPRTAASRCGS